MRRVLVYVAMIIGVASCAKDPVPSPPMVQVQASSKKPQEQISDDGAFPKDWRIEEIAKGAHFSAVPGDTHVLAWKRIEDDRSLLGECCLVLCRIAEDEWFLVSLGRNPKIKGSEEWDTDMTHMGPGYKGFPTGAWVWHDQRFKKRPSNKDVYDFMDKHRWNLGADDGWKLLGGAVCKTTWEAVLKEKPTGDFTQ